MGETRVQRQAHDRDRELRRSVGDELRRLREDAGLTRAAVADAAGIDRSYLPLIEAGRRDASNSVLAAVASVLGAEVSIRVYAATGPRIHDRTQAPMEEALLRRLHRRWVATPEVHLFRPARGVADVVLDDRRANVLVETEIQGQLRRLERQVRWQREKELSLPSSAVWRRPGPGSTSP